MPAAEHQPVDLTPLHDSKATRHWYQSSYHVNITSKIKELPMYLVTAKEMQTIDKTAIESFGIPGQVLMENAGRGAVDMLMSHFPKIRSYRVAVLAGRGNNGGDGFVMARYLLEMGVNTTTFVLSDKERIFGDAKANLTLLEKLIHAKAVERNPQRDELACRTSSKIVHLKCYPSQSPTSRKTRGLIEVADMETFQKIKTQLVHHDLFIDGILGTGLNSDVRGFYKEIIDTLNVTKKPIFSIDIPSGLNADTGKPMGSCIQATATATFGFAKIGQMIQPGKSLTGTLEVIDIGIPSFIAGQVAPTIHRIESKRLKDLFPDRPVESHKGSFGHLLVIAGSAGKTGAAALTCNSAMACGTGLVTLGIPESINAVMEPQVTESMTLPLPEMGKGCLSLNALEQIITASKGKSALALGPGLGMTPDTLSLVHAMIKERALSDIPMIIDADGLNALATDIVSHDSKENFTSDQTEKSKTALTDLKQRSAPTILTPHPGEMARLTGKSTREIQASRLDSARQFATSYQIILVLKGAGTVVALPDGTAHICPTGNPGMASGGMGDVLTGMIAGFMAQGIAPSDAALAGVYIHGLCGDILAENRGAFGFTATHIIDILPETIHTHIRQISKP